MASFTLTVPDEKLAEYKACILAAMPKPADSGLTDNQWLKRVMLDYAKALYKRGKDMLHTKPDYDDDIVS